MQDSDSATETTFATLGYKLPLIFLLYFVHFLQMFCILQHVLNVQIVTTWYSRTSMARTSLEP